MSRQVLPAPGRYADLIARHPTLGLIGNTPLFAVDALDLPAGCEVLAKAEWMNPGGSIKDRPVLRMLLEAVLSGELREGQSILDSSSGNAGIAYAMLGSILGYPVELVVPGNASQERLKRIKAHGARLVLTDPLEGYDEALRECHRRYEADPDRYFHCDQYANEHNWRAHYETTAAEIIAQTDGRLTHFVAGIGTGGTITGVGRRLKEHDPGIRIVAVNPDPFPGIEGLKPLTRPEDIRPEILDDEVIDESLTVTIEDAFDYCQLLAKRGVFVGQSSGANLRAVHEVARGDPSARVVTVFADAGERYFSTRLWD